MFIKLKLLVLSVLYFITDLSYEQRKHKFLCHYKLVISTVKRMNKITVSQEK
jgi:hypothetical protein